MTTRRALRCLSVLVVAAALLLTGTGCCLFHADDHDHESTGLDLCAAFAFVGPGAPPAIMLGLVGRSADDLSWTTTPVAIAIPDPPPRG